MAKPPVIAFIHATPTTMSPVTTVFNELLPSAELWHLLDDHLVTDAERAGGLTNALHQRMTTLIQYAVDAGADTVQLACSMYGAAVRATAQPVPVFAADQAMFDEIVRLRPGRVALLASLEPAAQDSAKRLNAEIIAAGVKTRVETAVVTQAKAASATGSAEALGRVLADAARAFDKADVLVLAQYSLAPALAQIEAAVNIPVLSGPHLAATTLAAILDV